ncbi:nucleoside deaminase, partial [Streptomyces sp. NPDC059466]
PRAHPRAPGGLCGGGLVPPGAPGLLGGPPHDRGAPLGSVWDLVRDRRLNHRPEVIGGVLDEECGRLLTGFFRSR